jgi:hypothetical protein
MVFDRRAWDSDGAGVGTRAGRFADHRAGSPRRNTGHAEPAV